MPEGAQPEQQLTVGFTRSAEPTSRSMVPPLERPARTVSAA